MDPLEKIHHVLRLKRSQLDQEVAAVQAKIREYDEDVKSLRDEKEDITRAVFRDHSENLAHNIVMLQKWKYSIDLKIDRLLTSKLEKQSELRELQQTLKEIMVKQDIMKTKLDAARSAEMEAWQESEAETRLEGWVTAYRI